MTWTITPTNLLPDDADAVAYIAAVEAADGEALEPAVRLAINSFVKGCKADGIWPAIKASCILAGARTLSGALVPLVGTAPTNYNFVAGDYNRKTGLVGDGSTKYLDSNRNNNADPQNSKHIAAYLSGSWEILNNNSIMGSGGGISAVGSTFMARDGASSMTFSVNGASRSGGIPPSNTASNTLVAIARHNSSEIVQRSGGTSSSINQNSMTPFSGNINVIGNVRSSFYSNARLAFYSIGEALDLALLDTRVTALVNALAAAIP